MAKRCENLIIILKSKANLVIGLFLSKCVSGRWTVMFFFDIADFIVK